MSQWYLSLGGRVLRQYWTMELLTPDPSISPEVRCFGGDNPLYQAYHDYEWGVEVRGEAELFERLCLETFASGLSWLIVLRKRPAFRAAFGGFDPPAVAALTDDDVERLMQDTNIVRNRGKINATIANAKALLAFQADGGSLDQLIWSHRPATHRTPQSLAEIPAQSPEAVALTKALRGIGLTWVGPVGVYATMQACGVVNDHTAACPRSARVV